MATRPTDKPEWSTSGTNTDPGAVKKAAGWLPSEKPPAQWWNWIWNNTYQWVDWLDQEMETLRARFVSDEVVYPTPKTRTIAIPPRAQIVGSWIGVFGESCSVETSTNQAVLVVDLGAHVPSECVITDVEVILTPGAARATVSARMSVEIEKQEVTVGGGVVSSVLAAVTDDGTANLQAVSVTASTSPAWADVTVDRSTEQLLLSIDASADAVSNADQVQAIHVTFTDPGPRNF